MHKRNQDILLVLKVVPHNNRNARYFQKSSSLEQYVKVLVAQGFVGRHI